MTDKQFWMKADQISDSKKTVDEKADMMAALLKTAYNENLKLMILYNDTPFGQQQLYLNLDDAHPNTFGNRGMLCYTSKRKSREDLRSLACNIPSGYVRTQDVINNLFNKDVIGRLLFNVYSEEKIIPVEKALLMKYIPGPYPFPENYAPAPPAEGFPQISI